MKKTILMLLVAITMGVSAVAQKFEVIREYPFDDFLQYYEEWPDDIGYNSPGLTFILSYKDKLLLKNSANSQWFFAEEKYRKIEERIKDTHKVVNGVLYLEFAGSIGVYIESTDINNPDYILDYDKEEYPHYAPSVDYMTEDMIFAQTLGSTMVSWKLLGEGKSEYYNAEKTQEMLDSGLAEKVGLTTNEYGSTFFFGEFDATSGIGPNFHNIVSNVTIKTEKYKTFKNLRSFKYIGCDKEGIGYFYRFKYNGVKYALEDPDNPIIVLIGVLDPWTKEVNVIELPAGDWDPSRKEWGLVARCSQCIDEEGNVYFTDCSKEKGVYQIKKLTNTWSKELGYSERKIGRMTANRIPLYEKKDTSAENNGYNYEHEYLWVLESGKKWSKVRKVDGREGYVETKYIRFN